MYYDTVIILYKGNAMREREQGFNPGPINKSSEDKVEEDKKAADEKQAVRILRAKNLEKLNKELDKAKIVTSETLARRFDI